MYHLPIVVSCFFVPNFSFFGILHLFSLLKAHFNASCFYFFQFGSSVPEPYSFDTDPDPAFGLNTDPDPDLGF